MYYTGDVVNPACWNAKDGRMRQTATCRNASEINEGLRQLQDKTEAIYLQYRNAGKELTLERFRQELDAFWKGRTLPPQAGPVSLLNFVEQLIQERRAMPDGPAVVRYKRIPPGGIGRAELPAYYGDNRAQNRKNLFPVCQGDGGTELGHPGKGSGGVNAKNRTT